MLLFQAGFSQILILAWWENKIDTIKAHLTIYTREYLLILILFFFGFCSVALFSIFYNWGWFCFSGVLWVNAYAISFILKCIYGLYLLIKDERKKYLSCAVSWHVSTLTCGSWVIILIFQHFTFGLKRCTFLSWIEHVT